MIKEGGGPRGLYSGAAEGRGEQERLASQCFFSDAPLVPVRVLLRDTSSEARAAAGGRKERALSLRVAPLSLPLAQLLSFVACACAFVCCCRVSLSRALLSARSCCKNLPAHPLASPTSGK